MDEYLQVLGAAILGVVILLFIHEAFFAERCTHCHKRLHFWQRKERCYYARTHQGFSGLRHVHKHC